MSLGVFLWIEEILKELNLSYRAKAKVKGSKSWEVDFLVQYLYPIAIEVLRGKRCSLDQFYHKLFKLLDLKRYIDLKPIIICIDNKLLVEDLYVALNYGVYVVFDKEGLRKAIEGADVKEVNLQLSEKLFKKASSEQAEACRKAIIERLSSKALSKEELIEQLSTSFHRKTVETQLKALVKRKVVKAIARRADGKALYSLLHKHVHVYDVSKRSRRQMLRQAILEALKSSEKPLNVHVLANMVGVGEHLYYIAPILHKLRREGLVDKVGDGWVLKERS